jgi:hypothetical protein
VSQLIVIEGDGSISVLEGDVPPIEVGRFGDRLKRFGRGLARLGKRIIKSPLVQGAATGAISAFAGPAGGQIASQVFGAINGPRAQADAQLLTQPGMAAPLRELVAQAPSMAQYVEPFLAQAEGRAPVATPPAPSSSSTATDPSSFRSAFW